MNNITKIIDMFCIQSSRRSFFFLVLIMFLLSFLDTLGLTIFYPITKALVSPDKINQSHLYQDSLHLFHLSNYNEFIYFLLTLSIIFFIFKFCMASFVTRYKNRKIYDGQIAAANLVFEKYLDVDFQFFKNNSNHSLIKIINIDLMLAYNQVIFNFISLCSDVILMIVFVILISLLKPYLLFGMLFLLFISLIVCLIKKKISSKNKINDQTYSEIQLRMAEIVTESISNYKITKINSLEETYRRIFRSDSKVYKELYIKFRNKAERPKINIELLFGLLLTGSLLLVMLFSLNVMTIIPIFLLILMSLFRLLPCITKISGAFYAIKFYMTSLNSSYGYLFDSLNNERKKNNMHRASLIESIEMNDINFSYGRRKILNNVNFRVQSGEHVFLIGETGSGKSSFVNLLLGLLRQESGIIKLNGMVVDELYSFISHLIAYVPQDLYFSNMAVENAIAHRSQGELQYDFMEYCMRLACIPITSDCFQNGFKTKIGENGSLLSGGEKQRLALSRALYMKPQLLILDEATSAVDSNTQNKILHNLSLIDNSPIIISITHKITSFNSEQKIYEIKNKCIHKVNSDVIFSPP